MPAGEVNETQDEEKHDHIGDDATTYHVIKSKKVKKLYLYKCSV